MSYYSTHQGFDMKLWKFEATLVRPEGIGTWTFAPVSSELAKEVGIRARQRVKGKIDGVPFACSLLPQGDGSHMIVVKKEVRDKIGKAAGQVVRIEMSLDDAPVRVEVPQDFARALREDKKALSYFEKIAPSHKKAYIGWIDEAKRPETRASRIKKGVEMLSKGMTR
jgi:hypothetical protein